MEIEFDFHFFSKDMQFVLDDCHSLVSFMATGKVLGYCIR